MRIGIDFGTTNSSVAYYDGSELHPVHLDPANENPRVLPSLIWIDRDYNTKLGSQAASEYLDKETGRRIVWSRQDLGAIEIIVAGAGSSPIHYWHDVHIVTDINASGRLLQSVKTVLRDPRYEGTRIFDRYYTIDELIAVILKTMKSRAEAQFSEPCDGVALGRPVSFSDNPAVSARAEEILYRAARFAGFRDITFQMEPVAAAHLYHRSAAHREVALVFDFGGGTLDLTVVEVGGRHPPRVIATRGVLIGGDDLDRRIMTSLQPYFGKGAKIDGGADFPPDFLDELHTWQTMPELSRPEPLSRIRRYQKTSDSPQAMLALETLVTQNVGFKLFREIERTKKALTPNLMARLTFQHEHIDIRKQVLRRDFEQMIEPELIQVERDIHAVLRDAGISARQVDVVLRTGGTSLVPAYVAMLERIFGHDHIREMDPLTSVVGGMAIVAHEESTPTPAYAYRYENPLVYVRATSGRHYEQTILRARMGCYTDRDYRIINLPLTLSGLHAVRPADLDYDSESAKLLRFKLRRPSRVYIVYQAKAEMLPRWLRGFKRDETIQVDIRTPGGLYPFFVYYRDFPAGAFALGGAHAKGYSGIVFLNYIMAAKPL
ncbi:MAG: Hsp70 family protein [Anaerolineae bacterium]|nr:Hsp70 family protein [Anaerolineae bacterium]